MNYQDHLIKFFILSPLKTKLAEEIVFNLMGVYTIFGAPAIYIHIFNIYKVMFGCPVRLGVASVGFL
jgi:hypothetical protein